MNIAQEVLVKNAKTFRDTARRARDSAEVLIAQAHERTQEAKKMEVQAQELEDAARALSSQQNAGIALSND